MSESEVVYFTDLDNTLFVSKRKAGQHKNPVSVGVSSTNEPASFMGRPHQMFFNMLIKTGLVIPITGRTSKQFMQVTALPFSSYRIVSFGAIVLNPDNTPNELWMHGLRSQLLPRSVFVDIAAKAMKYNNKYVVRIVEDCGILACVSIRVESESLEQCDIDFAHNVLPNSDWRVHHNGKKIEILPPYAMKEKAAEFVLKELLPEQERLVVGAGDSLSDLPFMHLCDYAIYPTISQIKEKLNK